MKPNVLHTSIMTSKARHIMTTNYDYCFEKSICDKFSDVQSSNPSTGERSHSLHRKYPLGDKTVWHIHGEGDDVKIKETKSSYPFQSIMIGFQQYARYLYKIQEYCSGMKGKFPAISSKVIEPEEYSKNILSWVDVFFTHDIVILGLGFDFSEFHLWWLLTYRRKMQLINSRISNSIKYYYADNPNPPEPKDVRHDLNAAKHDMLKALGVECISFIVKEDIDYFDGYMSVLMIEELIDK